ncbi:MAG: type II toxin-antitoxin system VapB family antitoxin [Lachnospiraceae bacterium]|nr:type II toxin-antitoxin system VapB family antitoxin [Lachnospiraceae bacterium]
MERRQTTKVFMNGRSQAVRIPLEFRFEEEEVYVNKIGDTLMLTPVKSLAETMRKGIELIPDDFFEDGRPDEIPTIREEL